jgi:hypothetical protein
MTYDAETRRLLRYWRALRELARSRGETANRIIPGPYAATPERFAAIGGKRP